MSFIFTQTPSKNEVIISFIFGILVDPPTITTSLMSEIPNFDCIITSSIGFVNFANKSLHKSSNFAFVTTIYKVSSSKKLSTYIGISSEILNNLLLFSQAIFNLFIPFGLFFFISSSVQLCLLQNSVRQYLTNLLSKSSPPK